MSRLVARLTPSESMVSAVDLASPYSLQHPKQGGCQRFPELVSELPAFRKNSLAGSYHHCPPPRSQSGVPAFWKKSHGQFQWRSPERRLKRGSPCFCSPVLQCRTSAGCRLAAFLHAGTIDKVGEPGFVQSFDSSDKLGDPGFVRIFRLSTNFRPFLPDDSSISPQEEIGTHMLASFSDHHLLNPMLTPPYWTRLPAFRKNLPMILGAFFCIRGG